MRRHARDGTAFEQVASYARAVRDGSSIAVSGTAATGPDGEALAPGDTYGQARICFERALRAVEELGGRTETVLRTRVYLARESDWREAVRAHAEAFRGVDPANTTLYVAGFIPPGVLLEVELDAVAAD